MIRTSALAASVKPSATIAAGTKARQLKAAGIKVFDFSLGEPDFNTPKHICDAAAQAAMSGQTHYTPTSGTAEVTPSSLNDAAIPGSAPNSTKRAHGQPPVPARVDGNTCTAGVQVRRSRDTSTRTRSTSSSALVIAPHAVPALRIDNSPASVSTHDSASRRTSLTANPN